VTLHFRVFCLFSASAPARHTCVSEARDGLGSVKATSNGERTVAFCNGATVPRNTQTNEMAGIGPKMHRVERIADSCAGGYFWLSLLLLAFDSAGAGSREVLEMG
jgi:hypothetical protein